MRGIGWLNMIRDGSTSELLNDLRFLKNASAAGIVARKLDDAAMCELYNYAFDGCGVEGDETVTDWAYTINAEEGWDIEGGLTASWIIFPDVVHESGAFTLGDDPLVIQAALEGIFGEGNVSVTGGPYPADYIVGIDASIQPIDIFQAGSWFQVPAPIFTLTQAGSVVEGPLSDSFVLINWDDPGPWINWSAASPPPWATEFLGIWVENWEGLEGDFDRTANARGWAFGGSNFTPLRPKHLTMTFDVILGATTERGLQHGFRWLSTMLQGLDQCDRADLVVFDECPPAGTAMVDWIWWMIRDAGVLAMPQWGEVLISEKNCQLRRVTFVLGARDAHKYRCPMVCTESTELIVPDAATACAPDYSWSEWFCNDNLDSVCCGVGVPTFDYTSRAAIVHIVSGPDGAPPMEIGWLTDSGTSTFRTRPLPSGELIIDSSRHEIRWVSEGQSSDGSAYVSASFGFAPVWAETSTLANEGVVCVRPLRICQLAGTSIMIETVDRV